MKRATAGFIGFLVLGFILQAGAAFAGPLAQVIEGAKKEGTVSAKLDPGFNPKSIAMMERNIKERYGVDLIIKFVGSTSFSNDVAEAIMENKAGAIPSYDLLTLSSHVATGMKAGALERVNWKSLLSEGTNPDVVNDNPLMQGAITVSTGYYGLMYNPDKVRANEVPKTLNDLANPKWEGRVGVPNSTSNWLRWSFFLGKEKVLPSLRAILKNRSIQGRYGDLENRFLIGEISLSIINSSTLKEVQDKGVPAAWQTLDFADVRENSLVVRKGAKHSNAAKLVALYLASPEGAKFLLEKAKAGTLYYSGNHEHEIRLQNEKQGLREIFADRDTGVLEFYNSKEASKLEKEIKLILQTGAR